MSRWSQCLPLAKSALRYAVLAGSLCAGKMSSEVRISWKDKVILCTNQFVPEWPARISAGSNMATYPGDRSTRAARDGIDSNPILAWLGVRPREIALNPALFHDWMIGNPFIP